MAVNVQRVTAFDSNGGQFVRLTLRVSPQQFITIVGHTVEDTTKRLRPELMQVVRGCLP